MKWFVFFLKSLTNTNGNDRIIKKTLEVRNGFELSYSQL